jgi:hypothetical protein
MKLYYFSEMPHHEFPDEEGEKYPSLRLELLEAQESRMDHPTTMRSIELMGVRVIPTVAKL